MGRVGKTFTGAGMSWLLWIEYMDGTNRTEEISDYDFTGPFISYTKKDGKIVGHRADDIKRYTVSHK